MPGFYLNTKSLDYIINHHVMKILENIRNDLRWKGNSYE